jgi:hypothetical protein
VLLTHSSKGTNALRKELASVLPPIFTFFVDNLASVSPSTFSLAWVWQEIWELHSRIPARHAVRFHYERRLHPDLCHGRKRKPCFLPLAAAGRHGASVDVGFCSHFSKDYLTFLIEIARSFLFPRYFLIKLLLTDLEELL